MMTIMPAQILHCVPFFPPVCKEAKDCAPSIALYGVEIPGLTLLLCFLSCQTKFHAIILFIMRNTAVWPSHNTSFSRFFCMIMSCTEFMVFLSNVVSVALVKCI